MSTAGDCVSERSANPIMTSMPDVCCPVLTKTVRPSRSHSSRKPSSSLLLLLLLLLLYGSTQSVAMTPDMCLDPRPQPDCSVAATSYYFDLEQNQCLSLFWSCPDEWLGNSFPTLEDCQATCLAANNEPDSETTPTVPDTESVTTGDTMATTAAALDVCLQPFENPFPCNVYPPGQWPMHYYFDSANQRCVRITFFGCGDGANHFETLEECMATCLATEATPTPTSTLVTPSTTHMTSAGDHMTPGINHMTPDTSTDHVTSSISTATTTAPVPSNYPSTEATATNAETSSSNKPQTTTEPETTTGTESETTTTRTEPESTSGTEPESTSEGPMPPSSALLSVFDVASIAIGLVALLLIAVLLALIAMVTYRYRRRRHRDAQQQMKATKPYGVYCKKSSYSPDKKSPAVMQKNCCYDASRTCFKPTLA